MKVYLEPKVELHYVENGDVLTLSDPMKDDPWDLIEL